MSLNSFVHSNLSVNAAEFDGGATSNAKIKIKNKYELQRFFEGTLIHNLLEIARMKLADPLY